jgi:hypothetical protein
MLGTLCTINHGNRPMPCPPQVVQELRNRVNSQAIVHRDHKHRSRCAAHRARRGPHDADVLKPRSQHLSACRINAHSARKFSRRNTIGSVTRSRSIYRLNDGFAPYKALALPRSRMESNAVSSAARFDRMTLMLKRITTRHVKRGVYRSARFIGKIISFSICAWCTAWNSQSGQWYAGCCLYLTSGPDAAFVVSV